MNPDSRKIIKSLVPPFVLDFYRRTISPYGFRGEYGTWEKAAGSSSGYDSAIILDRTKQALLKVKSGEAIYERDSVLFDKIQYSWPLLACLLYIASTQDNRLNLMDFGGSLGSSYYQNRNFLSALKELSWSIIEQPVVAECGRQNFADAHLKFYDQIDECLAENAPHAVLFSASLQYLPEPYKILDRLFQKRIKFILIDRLVVNDSKDLITIQNVDPAIYEASYPLRIFKEKNILDYFNGNNYELAADFDSLGGDFMVRKTAVRGRHHGYLFRLKDYDL